MKQRTSGFSLIIVPIVIATIALIGVAYLGYQYQRQSETGGTSIQTQLTDTIGTFRTNSNTNFSTIDSEIAAITSTQASYGNLATLNSPLPTANGGTGTTTIPSDTQFFSAAGTTPTWKSVIFGSGLLSTTTATSVTIGSAGFNNTANISFTGNDSFTAPLALTTATSTGSSTTDALNILPAGLVQAFAGPTSTTPTGWIICDGSSYATSTYPRLFAVIGYIYGGVGSSFNVPNLQQSIPVGLNTSNASTSAIGQTGGTTSTVILQTNLPSLIPTVNGLAQVYGGSGGSPAFVSAGNNGGTSFTFNQIGGSSTPISNYSPYVVMRYIIKY